MATSMHFSEHLLFTKAYPSFHARKQGKFVCPIPYEKQKNIFIAFRVLFRQVFVSFFSCSDVLECGFKASLLSAITYIVSYYKISENSGSITTIKHGDLHPCYDRDNKCFTQKVPIHI
jgi:hypothetical protein